MLGGCSKGKLPSRMVQFCLQGPEEMASFTSFMDSIAQEYRMEFSDGSGETEAELLQMNGKTSIPHPYLNIGADRNGDFGFGAGNLGCPSGKL